MMMLRGSTVPYAPYRKPLDLRWHKQIACLFVVPLLVGRRGKLLEIEFYAGPEAIIAVMDYRVQGAL